MTTEPEVIEGEVREVGLTVIEPREVERLDETATPEGMVALAARMATALADIVEKKKLFAVIQGKKYPQVEAWMTIGRMDNVAAREVRGGITRVEGGGFEAEVELIRLTDGMTVGYGSAMCGTPGDNPWATRPVHVQRSMAVTRATSRAFRQRYSWIMALAGYEPTPADEMPQQRPVGEYDEPPDRPELERRADGLVGTVAKGKPPVDLEVRQTPEGPAWGFKLMSGRKGYQALAIGSLADTLSQAAVMSDAAIEGQTCTVWGRIEMVPWEKTVDGAVKHMPPFARIAIERMSTADWEFPQVEPDTAPQDDDLSDLPDDWKEHSEYGEQNHPRTGE